MASDPLGSFVGRTAEGVIYFLIQSIRQEVDLLGGLENEVDKIRRELELVGAFLRDAERKDATELTIAWKAEVRDVAYETEDIIDEFMYNMKKGKREQLSSYWKIVSFLKTIGVRHRMATRCREIMTKYQEISSAARRYGLERLETRNLSSLNDTQNLQLFSRCPVSPDITDWDLVGMDANRERLKGWLMEDKPQRTVVAVTGMGGLGKTTLVSSAYYHVKNYFSCCAWVTVSQSYRIQEIIKSIVKQTTSLEENRDFKKFDSMDDQEIILWLYNHLEQERYLIVFDDVWDVNFWRGIKVALPDKKRGSRLMFTTRRDELASSLESAKHVLRMSFLDDEDSWTLFCRVAFRDISSRTCPSDLEPLARSILKKCEGLPLAIVAMSGLLASRNKTPVEWRKVKNSLLWHFSNNQLFDWVKRILLLSFDDLPYHLKHCFLYVSAFPEDFIISKKKLTRLWIAEGFVGEQGDGALEDQAESYLEELVRRSLIQTSSRDFEHGYSYKMHDIFRDLALQISEKENFLVASDKVEVRLHSKARRLAIYKESGSISSWTNMSCLRSVFIFDRDPEHHSFIHEVLPNFRFLRVLDLEGSIIPKPPDGLGELFNLRYLSLRNTLVGNFPISLKMPEYLQTLDLRGTWIKEVPYGVQTLRMLRHLTMTSYHNVPLPATKRICELTSLRTLSIIKASDEIVRNVGNLKHLRRFGIGNVRAADGAHLSSSLRQMDSLRSLWITAAKGELLKLDSVASHPHFLEKIALNGRLERVPPWVSTLVSLTRLHLWRSLLSEDPLPPLQALPRLRVLELVHDAYDGRQLTFVRGSFAALNYLNLHYLGNLAEVIIEEGSLPSMEQMVFASCQNMKATPEGIQQRKGLKVHAYHMSLAFNESYTQFMERKFKDEALGTELH